MKNGSTCYFKVVVKVITDNDNGVEKIKKYDYLVNAANVTQAEEKISAYLGNKDMVSQVYSCSETKYETVID
jgi:hypothetical protein